MKNYRLQSKDLDIIAYWITSCEDMERPSVCNATCPVYELCEPLRKRIWGKDILKDTQYRMKLPVRTTQVPNDEKDVEEDARRRV